MDRTKPSCSYTPSYTFPYIEGDPEPESFENEAMEIPLVKSEPGTESLNNEAMEIPLVKSEPGTENLQNDANVTPPMGSGEAAYMQSGKNKIFVEPLHYTAAHFQAGPSRPKSSTSGLDVHNIFEKRNSPFIVKETGCTGLPIGPALPNPIIPEESPSASLPIGSSLSGPIIPRELGYYANLPTGAALMNPNSLDLIDISPDRSRGVLKVITTEGTGELPAYGDNVAIHYDVWMRGDKVPFGTDRVHECTVFTLGQGQVHRAWELPVSTMKVGETSFFIVTSSYAYGANGYPPCIPPYASLFLHIDMYDWKLEDLSPKRDGTILRRSFLKGQGSAFPNDGSKVKIYIIGRYRGDIFDRRVIEFTLGDGCDVSLPKGIEKALYKFLLNERSVIYLKDVCGFEEHGIPSMSTVSYEVTLLSFEKVKQIWEMNSAEKLERARASRERGINFFKVENYKVALKYFKWIIICLENEPGVDPGTEELRKDLLISGYLNMSICFLKLGNCRDAVKSCDKALKIQPTNEKALFRSGQAKMWSGDWEQAMLDFIAVTKIYPHNKAALNNIRYCQVQVLNQRRKDIQVYGNMFETFVKQDQERMKNMKTETGVWQNENGGAAPHHVLSEAEMLIEQHNSLLRDAKLIQLSSNVSDKF